MIIKKLVILALIGSCIFAKPLVLNDTVTNVTIPNQFEKDYTINNNIKQLIVSSEKAIGEDINSFLATQKSTLLTDNKTVFIVNISKMPSIIASLFAIPKMKKYKYDILLIDDEDDDRFVSQEGKASVYELENGMIKNIYFKTTKEIITNLQSTEL